MLEHRGRWKFGFTYCSALFGFFEFFTLTTPTTLTGPINSHTTKPVLFCSHDHIELALSPLSTHCQAIRCKIVRPAPIRKCDPFDLLAGTQMYISLMAQAFHRQGNTNRSAIECYSSSPQTPFVDQSLGSIRF